MLVWEEIAKNTSRLRVYNGWVVRVMCLSSFPRKDGAYRNCYRISLIYIPDPAGAWHPLAT